jgi:hypothetical protein
MKGLTFYAKYTIQFFFMNCWGRDVGYNVFKISYVLKPPPNFGLSVFLFVKE